MSTDYSSIFNDPWTGTTALGKRAALAALQFADESATNGSTLVQYVATPATKGCRVSRVGTTSGGAFTLITLVELERLDEVQKQMEADLVSDQIVRLVEDNSVNDARALLKNAESRGLVSERLASWARALALPRMVEVRPASDAGPERNYSWMESHKGDFKGQWVALRDGELVDVDANRVALHRRLRDSDRINGALFVFMT